MVRPKQEQTCHLFIKTHKFSIFDNDSDLGESANRYPLMMSPTCEQPEIQFTVFASVTVERGLGNYSLFEGVRTPLKLLLTQSTSHANAGHTTTLHLHERPTTPVGRTCMPIHCKVTSKPQLVGSSPLPNGLRFDAFSIMPPERIGIMPCNYDDTADLLLHNQIEGS